MSDLSIILVDGQNVDMAAFRSWLTGLDGRITSGIDAAAIAAALSVVYETRAELDADLAHEAGTVALVWGDPTDTNNDLYTKTGASGAGAWTLTSTLNDLLSRLVQPSIDAAADSAASSAVSAGVAELGYFGRLLAQKTGYFWDVNDPLTCFSDAAGTTQADIGDRVELLRDKSGRENHFTKHASYAAPILRVDKQGRRYLEFIGNTEDRALEAASGGDSSSVSAFAVVRCQTESGADQNILDAQIGSSGWVLAHDNIGRFTVWGSGGATAISQTMLGSSAAIDNKIGQVRVIGGTYDGAGVRTFNHGYYGGYTPGTYTPRSTASIMMGHNIENSVGEANTHIYALCVFEQALSTQEEAIAFRFLADRAPMHGRHVNAISRVRNLIELGSADVRIVQLSDSLGDHQGEFFVPLAQIFAQMYPQAGVVVRTPDAAWDGVDPNDAWYEEWVLNPTPAGGQTIFFDRFSGSGKTVRLFMGDQFRFVSDFGEVHLLISNAGKNTDDSAGAAAIKGDYLGAFEQVKASWPNCSVVALEQPRNYYDDEEDAKWDALRQIQEAWRELFLIPSRVWDGRYRQDDYEDWASNAIHPQLTDIYRMDGAGIVTMAFMDAWHAADVLAGSGGAHFTATAAASLVSNADFATDVAGWTAIGAATLTHETVDLPAGAAGAIKIAGGTGAKQEISSANFAAIGSHASLFVKSKGQLGASPSGRIALVFLDAAGTELARSQTVADGAHFGDAYSFAIIAGLEKPAGATRAVVELYSGGGTAYFSEVSLVSGTVPKALM